jgi:hypothetical protein
MCAKPSATTPPIAEFGLWIEELSAALAAVFVDLGNPTSTMGN